MRPETRPASGAVLTAGQVPRGQAIAQACHLLCDTHQEREGGFRHRGQQAFPLPQRDDLDGPWPPESPPLD